MSKLSKEHANNFMNMLYQALEKERAEDVRKANLMEDKIYQLVAEGRDDLAKVLCDRVNDMFGVGIDVEEYRF